MIDPQRIPTDPSQSYNAGVARRKIERPASVSALAFLGIIVGGLLVFCDVILMVSNLILLNHPERSSPGQGLLPQDPLIMKFGAANAVAGTILGMILLGASLAALSLRPVARQIILIWSIAFVMCGVARTIGEIKYVGPANLAWIERNKPDAPAFASGQMQAVVVPKAVALLSLYCVLPLLYLAFWTRPAVKDAFERAGNMP